MLQYDDELSQRLGLPTIDNQNYSTDTNNNSDNNDLKTNRGDKYSLRPRSVRRRNNNNNNNNCNNNEDAEETANIKIRKTNSLTKPKQKAAPLSKYRRKTANARERSRMREINQAFEALRKAVPQMSVTQQSNEKLTKITTLRLAMKYISTLSAVLTSNSSPSASLLDPTQDIFSECSELDCFLLESDGESLPLNSDLSDHSLTPADFSVDFPDDSLTPVDFTPLSPDLTDHLTHFDPFLSDFS